MSAEITMSTPALISTFQIEEIIRKLQEFKAELAELKAENRDLRATLNDTQELQAHALKRITELEAEKKDLSDILFETQEILAFTCKRTVVIENAIFAHDEEGDLIKDDEDKPFISAELTRAPQVEPEPKQTPSPESTLDLKACAVVEDLLKNVKPNVFGEYTYSKKMLDELLTKNVSPDIRVKEVTRQTKDDIFNRAVKLYPDTVYIQTSGSGNKTKILALKPSAKRLHTDAIK